MEKILIKFLVDSKEELQSDKLRVWDLDLNRRADKPVTVPIFIHVVNHHSALNPCRLILVQITALPCFLGNNLLRFIIHVVNRSGQSLAILEIEAPEHTYRA